MAFTAGADVTDDVTAITAALWNTYLGAAGSLAYVRSHANLTDLTTGNPHTQYAQLAAANEFTESCKFDKQIYCDAEVDDGNSGAADTIDLTTGPYHHIHATGDCVLTVTLPSGPCRFVIRIIGDGSQRTFTWPATFKWSDAGAPTLTATLNKWTVIGGYFDGTNCSVAASLGHG